MCVPNSIYDLLTNPDLSFHIGEPVRDFQPLLDDFAIGFEGSPLRALFEQDGGGEV